MLTKIKFCGFTREQDALTAIDLGVDALGFVFYEKSKRCVIAEQLDWLQRLPAFVQITGLFVNPEKSFVDEVTGALPIDLLQFHGNESPEFCAQFRQRYIKAVPMQGLDEGQAIQYMNAHTYASGFLLDNYGITEIGGSGTTFDWSQIPNNAPAPMIMAGGLTAENVSQVIRTIHPYAVDASSAIEDSPGIKCAEKMATFIQACKMD